jgi:DNA-binding NtrC family response regulator
MVSGSANGAGANRPLQGARVLILEDEFFIADDLARALRSAGAEPVGPVGTIQEAEGMLSTHRVDAAILDLNLRGEMAGDFAQRLAATRLPCVIVSGYGPDAIPASVKKVRHLEKPVSPAKVIETLGLELSPPRD